MTPKCTLNCQPWVVIQMGSPESFIADAEAGIEAEDMRILKDIHDLLKLHGFVEGGVWGGDLVFLMLESKELEGKSPETVRQFTQELRSLGYDVLTCLDFSPSVRRGFNAMINSCRMEFYSSPIADPCLVSGVLSKQPELVAVFQLLADCFE